MFKRLLLISFALCSGTIIAQNMQQIQSQKTNSATINNNITTARNCGTVEYHKLQAIRHPELVNQQQEILKNIYKLASEINQNKSIKNNVVHTIPVVVHVVYNNASENISDAQIQSQIDVLNRDFRNTNSDNVPSAVQNAFGSLRSDAQIEFCLAQRDPSNHPTNGITRTSTTHGSFYLENDVKSSSTGGHDAWNSSAYLNLWVCDLSQSLLGYAQFPGNDPSTDGVVIRYNSFGSTGNVAAPYNKGRTATHEIGHWFGLQHIWGDEPDCAADDNINDTPQQKDQNDGCPSFPQTTQSGGSCSGTTPGSMYMNYMDYTDDACMYMFTTGQSNLMNATLLGERSSILTSEGCLPAPITGYSCDTLSNLPATFNQAIYTAGASAQGYLAGHNGYFDIAKAEKYNNTLPNYQVKGCILKFSRISYSGTSSNFNVRVWNDNGGVPFNILTTQNVTYSSFAPDVISQTYSYVSFSNPADVIGNYYVGVDYAYSGTDTLALYTTTVGNLTAGASKAFERAADGSWHNINTALNLGGWNVDLSLFIFPIICDKFESVSEVSKSALGDIIVFPNPSNDEIFLNIDDLNSTNVFLNDIAGNRVELKLKSKTSGLVSYDVSNLSSGIYFIEIRNSGFKAFKKIVIE